MTCDFVSCDRTTTTAKYCRSHTQQIRRYGKLKPLRERSETPREKQPRQYLPCSFQECDRDRQARGWCNAHYGQVWRGETLRPLGQRLVPVAEWDLERILSLCSKSGDCRLFGTDQVSKYPQIRFEGRPVVVHRVAYRLHFGQDITGVPIHHKCGNSHCVNPEHLEPASAAENTLEMLGRKAYEAQITALEARVKKLEAELAEARAVIGR